MYNRYIPQQDGSYTKNRVPEQKKPQSNCQPPEQPKPVPPTPHRPARTVNPLGFFQQLLGKDFDTGDLIVILLLLLMAGDNPEERNNAVLTIALYFLM